jgi:peptide/nickel transport system substrate-binding protein
LDRPDALTPSRDRRRQPQESAAMNDRRRGNLGGSLASSRLDRRRLLQQSAGLGLAAAALAGALPTGAAARAQDASGGTVNVAWAGDLTNLTPLFSSSGQEQALSSLMFGTLIKPNDNLEPIPDLAESWEISPDATTFTFTLRSGLTWSDGQPLTADDVIFTFERAIDRRTGSERAGTFLSIQGAEEYANQAADTVSGLTAPDPQTVRIVLTSPNASFLTTLQSAAGFGIQPKHILQDVPPDQFKSHPFMAEPTVGAGAYIFATNEVGQYLELQRNDSYFGGTPPLERMVIKILTLEVALAQLESGELDLASRIPVAEAERVQSNANLVLHSVPSPSITQIAINTAQPYLSDKRVRQAFMHAIDRQGIIDSVFQGQGEIVNSPIIGPTWMGQPEFNEYPFDPDRARVLLDEAAWDFDQTIEMMYPNTITQEQDTYQVIIQQQLSDVGVKLELRAYDQTEIERKRMIREGDRVYGDYDLYSYGGGVYRVDPSVAANYYLSEIAGNPNIQYYANPTLDQLFADGIATSDLEARKTIYTEVARILNEDLPTLFLWSPNSLYASSARLQSFKPPAYINGYLWNAEEWTVTG